jgi:2-keto-3-deoxy-L-rhamnonate aldolase RhmA
MVDYASRANTETRLSILIEHPKAIENLDDILAVDGLDGAIAVPFNLAINMGFSDGPGHPEVQEALTSAQEKISGKSFRLTSFAVTPEQGQAALAHGAQLLFLGFDTMVLPAAIDNYLRLLNAST